MSVIVQDTAGDVWLYCKGADSEIFPIINEGKISETEFHVADFSKVLFYSPLLLYCIINNVL